MTAEDFYGREVMQAILSSLRGRKPIDTFLGPSLDATTTAESLVPVSEVDAEVTWFGVNGSRVDVKIGTAAKEWHLAFGTDGTTIEWLQVFTRPPRFDGVEGGRVVLLNGPSGVGKSTVLTHLQLQQGAAPWVIFDEPEQVGSVTPNYLIWRESAPALHAGFLAAIAAVAASGNFVAVAAAGHNQAEFEHHLGEIPTLKVGLYCETTILLGRERERPDRWGGLAASSLGIHEGWQYDLTFDTSHGLDPSDMAAQIHDVVAHAPFVQDVKETAI